MPSVFRYLVKKDRRDGAEAVEDRYKRADLVKKPVLWNQLTKEYVVFGSRREMLEWYTGVPEAERHYHEVVFGWQSQRLHFDFDAPAHKLDALPEGTLSAALLAAGGEAFGPQVDARLEDLSDYIDELLGASPPPPPGAASEPGGEPGPGGADDPLELLLGGLDPAVPSGAAPAPAPVAAAPAPAPPAGAPPSSEELRAAKARAIMGLLIEAILDELYVGYYGIEDILPSREDLAVTDSSGPAKDGWKYSYHVVALPYAVADNEEAREFTSRVLERLPPPIRAFVDPDVNKNIQNFRLAGSAKPGTGRFKRATPEAARAFGTARDVGTEDLLVIAPAGARILQRVYTDAEAACARRRRRPMLGPQCAAVRAVLELAAQAGVTAGHAFSEARGTLLCFLREEATHCRICEETHSRDNSLMLSIEPAEGGHEGAWPGSGAVTCRVVEHCRQARGRGRAIGELVLRAEDLRGAEGPRARGAAARDGRGAPHDGALREQIAARVAAIREGRVNPHDALASEFERLPEAQKTVYAEDQMRDYELVPTLAVLAQMKLGKTKAMRRYLDAHFPAEGFETKVVRFVTFRQTFSRSLAEAFPDFALYSDLQGDLDPVRHPRLIVQVESLHRLKMPARPEPVDLLVLDEAESILAQFNSGLHRHFNAAFAMFQWMLRTARHVVCMDANLGDRTYRTLLRMRPAHPPHFHWNRYARAADDAFYFTADKGAWLERLHAAVRAGQRVVLPTNSLTEGKAYEAALRREFPRLQVLLYSSETLPSEKARHFGDVHTFWGALDVLIYTPTCSAGVSFEREHFDVLFADFCDVSCDVETCRQMLGRVRSLRTREHYVCLRASGAALPTTVDDIRRLVYDKRAGLYRTVEDTALHYEYAADGSVQYYESDYFHLWLETVRVANLSRNEFARRFIDQVADTGARVEALAAGDPGGAGDGAGVGAALLADHRDARGELKAARCEAVAAAAELMPEEAAHVREALQSQLDVEPATRLAYEKYQLREAYSWHGRPLDAGFVEAYQDSAARRVYRNLARITREASLLDSLRAIRAQEANHYTWTMESRSEAQGHVNEGRDLLRDKTSYVFQAHFLAIWVLRLAGFACITDRRRVHEQALEARLRGALPALKRSAERLVFEFEVRKPGFDRLAREPDRGRFLAGMLRTVNAVLRAMYGLEVKRVTKRAGGSAYYLNHSPVGRLFVFSSEPEPDDITGGPRPHISSSLAPLSVGPAAESRLRVDLFLEEAFYSRAEAAADEDRPPDVAGSEEPAPPEVRSVGTGAEAPGSASRREGPRARTRPSSESRALAGTSGDAALNDFLQEEFERLMARSGH